MVLQTYLRDSLGLLPECQGNLYKAEYSDLDSGDFSGGPEVKNLPCSAGHVGSIPGQDPTWLLSN